MFDELLQKIWNGIDPYQGFNAKRYRPDLQGWNSQHPFLADTINLVRPSIVVEVGVWKGRSTIKMAKTLQESGIDGAVIAIDTWLGSWDHWERPAAFEGLLCQNGYPSIFYTFLTNVLESNLEKYIIPLPSDSGNASFILKRRKISPQIIHIDAAHDYDAVTSDLQRWWPLLAEGGYIIADDYDTSGKVWPQVRKAVDDFLEVTPHDSFGAIPVKCRFRKTPTQESSG